MGKTRAARKKNVLDKKQQLFAYLCEQQCAVCGEGDPLVLEFDHLHDKKTDVSKLIQSDCSWEYLLAEVGKCEVLCANCHRRKTLKEANSYRYQFWVSAKAG